MKNKNHKQKFFQMRDANEKDRPGCLRDSPGSDIWPGHSCVLNTPSHAKSQVSAWTLPCVWTQRPLWPHASAVPISLSPLRPHGPFAGALSSETVSLVLCHSSRESPGRPCPRSASAWTSSWALLPDLPPPLPPPGLLPSIAHQPHEMKWRRSVLSDSATPWTVAHRAPLSREFSRQEYWSGSPCSPPEDLPDPGIESRSPALQADALPSEPPGKPDQWQDVSYSLASVFSVPPSPWVSSQMFLLDRYLWLKEYVTKRMAPEALSPWSHSQHALPMWTQRDDWWQPQGKQRRHRGWTAFGSTQHTLTSPLLWVRSWVRG